MFDFESQIIGTNTRAILRTDSGVDYMVRFYGGTYRSFETLAFTEDQKKKIRGMIKNIPFPLCHEIKL